MVDKCNNARGNLFSGQLLQKMSCQMSRLINESGWRLWEKKRRFQKGEYLAEKLIYYVEGKQQIDCQKNKQKKNVASISFCCLTEVWIIKTVSVSAPGERSL